MSFGYEHILEESLWEYQPSAEEPIWFGIGTHKYTIYKPFINEK